VPPTTCFALYLLRKEVIKVSVYIALSSWHCHCKLYDRIDRHAGMALGETSVARVNFPNWHPSSLQPYDETFITYSRLLRVNYAVPPGFESATCRSRNLRDN